MADMKNIKMNITHYRGVFEVEKNEFQVENFTFFTTKYLPIFQDGGHEKIVK